MRGTHRSPVDSRLWSRVDRRFVSVLAPILNLIPPELGHSTATNGNILRGKYTRMGFSLRVIPFMIMISLSNITLFLLWPPNTTTLRTQVPYIGNVANFVEVRFPGGLSLVFANSKHVYTRGEMHLRDYVPIDILVFRISAWLTGLWGYHMTSWNYLNSCIILVNFEGCIWGALPNVISLESGF